MEFEIEVKLAIYRYFAQTGRRPALTDVAEQTGAALEAVRAAYQTLRAQRVLVLDEDGESIRMAPPFSGVPTQHLVEAGGVGYFANCAWDSLGILAALRLPGTVRSRCEESLEPLNLPVDTSGPAASDWLFHCLVPAAKWWADIVFT